MADFFDKMLVGINKGVASVSEGSKNLMEKAKLNTAVSDAEKEKNRLAEQLGFSAYNLQQNGVALPEELLAICEQITAKNSEIQAMQQKLVAMEAAKEGAAPTQAGPVCSACGAVGRPGGKFCGKCGGQMQ